MTKLSKSPDTIGLTFLHTKWAQNPYLGVPILPFYLPQNQDLVITLQIKDEFVMGCMEDEVLVKRLSANPDK